ncbi:MAG: Holliday junction branch migration protein RuvA [Firmicutes bacterium]|nr:Holliday junction branch migration protein RuvA [Alicyclobacillaceae bacterium]MCL6498188.1 Holliday junction branch migration protein RuvA [Bacillota bacterium]
MIAELKGVVAHKEVDQCVLDVGGVGYLVYLSSRTAQAIGEAGARVHLYTHLLVREEEWRLFGFATAEERRCFLDLIAVGGVGPKLALQLLSRFSPEELERVVAAGEWERLQAVPGIGVRTAQRLQVELAGRWKARPLRSPAGPQGGDEALAALLGLGYRPEEAQAALAEVPPEWALSRRIREALRRLDPGSAHREG